MIVVHISTGDAQQRFDKYLKKLLKNAPDSLIYKQLRKKNIVLNGKKADGSEKLSAGDTVKLFFSDETYAKLTGAVEQQTDSALKQYLDAYSRLKNKIAIVYENEHILVADKQSGILSQKAKSTDISVNEWFIGYLLEKGSIGTQTLAAFKPSICNRLDRNTSGMIICGKTLAGSQYMSEIIKNKMLEKYYYCLIMGNVKLDTRVTGYHYKDKLANFVEIYDSLDKIPKDKQTEAEFIDTSFTSVISKEGVTLVEAQLFTGKAHQIRAHLASIGHPIIGDTKYGDTTVNEIFQKIGVNSQLLHSHKLVFPDTSDERFSNTSGLVLETKLPPLFGKVMGDK